MIQKDGRWIIKGSNGRIHVIEQNGSEVVTTFKNTAKNTQARINDGRWSRSTEAQLKEFSNIFSEYVRW